MKKTPETGRSMVEMLGVLAIIGVLTAGGMGIVGKARESGQISQLISEVSAISATSRRLSCQYEDDYGSYTKMLYLSDAYSDALTYKDNSFVGPMDTIIKITGNISAFKVEVSGLDEEACVRMASTNWGGDKIQGFLGVCVGECSGNGTTGGRDPLSASTAADKCGANSTVVLNYKGCR